jgi:hypothetical protein
LIGTSGFDDEAKPAFEFLEPSDPNSFDDQEKSPADAPEPRPFAQNGRPDSSSRTIASPGRS